VVVTSNDTYVEELEEFAAAVRGDASPEMGGAGATESLAVIRAGIRSARDGRRVAVAESVGTANAARQAIEPALLIV
jgi:predicted dehydrogenase